MSFLTRLLLHLGTVVVLAVIALFGAGIYAATQVQQDALRAVGVVVPDAGSVLSAPVAVEKELEPAGR